MKQKEDMFVSRREAARLLGVSPTTIPKLSEANGVRIWKVRTHNRLKYHRDDILSLLESDGIAMEAGV